jgi:hypothetical protein
MSTVIRALFASSEPSHCLRPGERIIGAVEAGGLMTEWLIEREDRTRRATWAQAAFLARLFPPMGIVPRRKRHHVGHARHNGRAVKRRR